MGKIHSTPAIAVLLFCFGLASAHAQAPIVTNAEQGQLYFQLGGPGAFGPPPPFTAMSCRGAGANVQFCDYAAGINIKDIATTSQLNAASANVATMVNSLSNSIARATEVSAIAAAMKDAIPNAGDRFAIRFNAAGYESAAAGAIGVSWNVNDTARLHLNYGQGRSQGIVSGGLNLSFR